MGFYGVKTDYDRMIRQLTEQIDVLQTARINSSYQNLVLSKQINLSTIGTVIVQNILSAQYASSCIAAYFKRQWVQPVLEELQPVIGVYRFVPLALTEIKGEWAQKISQRERLALVNLSALWSCAVSIQASPFGLLRGVGSGAGVFFFSSWILLPEFGERYLNFAAKFL